MKTNDSIAHIYIGEPDDLGREVVKVSLNLESVCIRNFQFNYGRCNTPELRKEVYQTAGKIIGEAMIDNNLKNHLPINGKEITEENKSQLCNPIRLEYLDAFQESLEDTLKQQEKKTLKLVK